MRAAITKFHFCFSFFFFVFGTEGFFSPLLFLSFSWQKHHLLFRRDCPSHTFHSHLCERVYSAVQRQADSILVVCQFHIDWTNKWSPRSFILHSPHEHSTGGGGGEIMCEQLNWVNCGIFLPMADLHDSAFYFPLCLQPAERKRETVQKGGDGGSGEQDVSFLPGYWPHVSPHCASLATFPPGD